LWRSGNFETLPAEANHPHRIESSYQALLLDSAQALDESLPGTGSNNGTDQKTKESTLSKLARFDGVEFILSVGGDKIEDSWGLENADSVKQWAKKRKSNSPSLPPP